VNKSPFTVSRHPQDLLLISHGIGSQVQRPLATVVVGGMTIGPFMLLIVAPALRMLFLSEDTAGRDGDDVSHLQGHDEVDDI
jgi:hypothetical protein